LSTTVDAGLVVGVEVGSTLCVVVGLEGMCDRLATMSEGDPVFDCRCWLGQMLGQ
jgi:hypothetical protein